MPRFVLLALLLTCSLFAQAQSPPLYFPPTTGTTWATVSPQSLGWCQPRLDSLLNFLGRKRTKSFIILKDGRLAVEHYYGTYTRDSLWYWASAGKTLAATLTGIAQQEGLLTLNTTVTSVLGPGWTSAPAAKEQLITVLDQLRMTHGLDDTPPPPCDELSATPGCLRYLADAGTRWAYHTGPYRLVQDVIARRSGLTINQYTNQRLESLTGMQGQWVDYVYYSRARDMARFGLLMLNRGTWAQTPVLRDAAFFQAMTTPSQPYNRSYGYLWWLNGQASYMLPGASQQVIPGSFVPTAPPDMIAALGKNDQKIYVVPSLGLVIVRQGESAGVPRQAVSSFDTDLWRYITAVFCAPTRAAAPAERLRLAVFPNPATHQLTVQLPAPVPGATLRLLDALGRERQRHAAPGTRLLLSVADLPAGLYSAQLRGPDGQLLGTQRVVKQ